MKDKMLTEQEQDQLQCVFNELDEFLALHESLHSEEDKVLGNDKDFGDRPIERVYVMSFMMLLRDMVKSSSRMKQLVNMTSEDEYIKIVTGNGERSIREVENKLALRMTLAELEDEGAFDKN